MQMKNTLKTFNELGELECSHVRLFTVCFSIFTPSDGSIKSHFIVQKFHALLASLLIKLSLRGRK